MKWSTIAQENGRFASDHAASSTPELAQKRGKCQRKVEADILDVVKNAIPNGKKKSQHGRKSWKGRILLKLTYV